VTWRVERDDLLKDIKTAAKMQGWNVQMYSHHAEPQGGRAAGAA
jgi:hypothetical protein